MKIAYNPIIADALTTAPANNDITFDLRGLNIFVRGVKFKGTDTTYLVFKKHTSSSGGGYNGLVPVPSYTPTNIRFLREDGIWQVPIDNKVLLDNTTTSNFKPVVLGFNDSTTPSDISTSVTLQVYTTTSIYVLPSSGSLWANKLYSGGKEVITEHLSLEDYVTLHTPLIITGLKTFITTIYLGELSVRRAISFVDDSRNCILSDVKGATILRGSIIRFQQVNGTDAVTIQNSKLFVQGNEVWHKGNDSSLFVSLRDTIGLSEIDNFVNRTNGTYLVAGSGSSGLLTVFKGTSSTSSLELFTWYDWSRVRMRMSIDSNRYSAWRDLAFLDSNVASSTLVKVTQQITDIGNYPIVWSNEANTDSNNSSLFKSWNHLYYNPASRILTSVGGINAGNSRLTTGTGDVYLEWWRGTNASWRILNTEGTFKLLCNYLNNTSFYLDIFNLYYSTGHASLKGDFTLGGLILRVGKSSSWVKGRDYSVIRMNTSDGYSPIWSAKTLNGSWDCGTYVENRLHFSYITDSNYNSNNNTQSANIYFNPNGLIGVNGIISTGTIRIKCTTSNYQEGLTIQNADSTWCTIRLGNTNDVGTTENTWSIHRTNNNNFSISRNSSDGANGLTINKIGCVGIGYADNTIPGYRLSVNGTGYFANTVNIPTLRIYGTSDNMAWDRGHGRIVFAENVSDALAVSIVYTSYDSVRSPAGLKITGSLGNEWFEAPRIIKTGSNDNYVLLGGGGHILKGNASNNIPINNGTVCTNLNADMLDGLHEYAFSQRHDFSFTTNTLVENWAKSNSATQRAGNIFSVSGWAWASSSTLVLSSSINIDRMRYSALSIRNGNLNGEWLQQALLFLPTYSDSNMIYLVQMTTSGTAGSVSKSVKRYADYDTVLHSNVASANKWATARTLTLGSYLSGSVSIDGSLDVTLNANVLGLTSQGNKTAISGTTLGASGVRMYQVYNNGYPTTYGNLLNIGGSGFGELLLGWTADTSLGRLYYRSKRDIASTAWSSWGTVAYLTDNVASATNADMVDGNHASAFSYKSWWHWSGQSGLPAWLWGGNSENNYYVYNPSNFRVSYASSAGNADTLDGYHANTSQNPFGKIPIVASDGVMEIGRYIDFHYNSSDTTDFRTRLLINHSSGSYTATLPAKTGTLAMTSDILNPTNYYWANIKISSSYSTTTTPTFGALTVSNLSNLGGLKINLKYVHPSSSYTVLPNDCLLLVSEFTSTVNIYFPSYSLNLGRILIVKGTTNSKVYIHGERFVFCRGDTGTGNFYFKDNHSRIFVASSNGWIEFFCSIA